MNKRKAVRTGAALLAAVLITGGAAAFAGDGTYFSVLGITAGAQTTGMCGDSLSWTADNGTLTISGVGAMYDYKTDSPFSSDALGIREAVINGASGIGSNLFRNCQYLTSVSLPDTLTKIGSWSFASCSELKSIVLPGDLSEIGEGAFSGCTSLTSITLPQSLTVIGASAFACCEKMKYALLPENISGIEDYTFQNCSSLSFVSIPAGIGSIGKNAFSGCTSLRDIYFGGSDTQWAELTASSGTYIPEGCTVHINEDSDFIINNNVLVYYKGKGGEVTVPDGVTAIGDGVFEHNGDVTGVTLPASVRSIGSCAFMDSGIRTIDIPESVTSVGELAFAFCPGPAFVSVPESVSSFGERVFTGCTGLRNAIVDGKFAALPEGTFSDCTSLFAVTLGDSIKRIGENAFSGCTSLVTANIPAGVSDVSAKAYTGCSSLKSFYAPGSSSFSTSDGVLFNKAKDMLVLYPMGKTDTVYNIGENSAEPVNSIGSCAFFGNPYIKELHIPASVTVIGESAFYLCSGLTDIWYDGSRSKWESMNTEKARIPEGCTVHFVNAVLTVNTELNLGTGAVNDEPITLTVTDSTGTAVKTESSVSGNFVISDIAPGEYTVRLTRTKCAPLEVKKTVTEENAELSLLLLLYGDVTADGEIDSKDATMILRYYADLPNCISDITTGAVDANRLKAGCILGTEKPTPNDATQILKYSVGQLNTAFELLP